MWAIAKLSSRFSELYQEADSVRIATSGESTQCLSRNPRQALKALRTPRAMPSMQALPMPARRAWRALSFSNSFLLFLGALGALAVKRNSARNLQMAGIRHERRASAGEFPNAVRNSRTLRGYIVRCPSAGRFARSVAIRAGSIPAVTTPAPLSRRASTSPQGSTIIVSPWVSRPLAWRPPCAGAIT